MKYLREDLNIREVGWSPEGKQCQMKLPLHGILPHVGIESLLKHKKLQSKTAVEVSAPGSLLY